MLELVIMLPIMKKIALLALLTGFATVTSSQASGFGITTRYWNCCKGSCGRTGKASISHPITSCDKNDSPLTDFSVKSGCDTPAGSEYVLESEPVGG